MLGQRVMTAVVLLAILAAVFSFSHPYLVALMLALIACAATWEWLNMQPRTSASVLVTWAFSIAGVLGIFGGFFFSPLFVLPFAATALACVFWLLVAPSTLRSLQLPMSSALARGLLGGVLIVAACGGVLFLGMKDKQILLAVLLIPIIADTAAYFVGKAFGKHKLAPAISPGKTIEGALGGLAAVGLVHGAWVISQGWHWWWIPIFVVLAVFSIVGDLFESLLKRQAGVKDSSNLLPGHGGVLDRIDAQLPVLPLAALAFHFLPLK